MASPNGKAAGAREIELTRQSGDDGPNRPGLVRRVGQAIRFAFSPDGNKPGWFGAAEPMPPVAPEEEKGRQFDYPYAVNRIYQPRGEQGENAIGFDVLRRLADPALGGLDLMRLVIETRKDQMAGQKWAVRERGGRSDGGERARAIESALREPDGVNSYRTWQRLLLEDLLVIDAPTIFFNRTKAKPALPAMVDPEDAQALADGKGGPAGMLPPKPGAEEQEQDGEEDEGKGAPWDKEKDKPEGEDSEKPQEGQEGEEDRGQDTGEDKPEDDEQRPQGEGEQADREQGQGEEGDQAREGDDREQPREDGKEKPGDEEDGDREPTPQERAEAQAQGKKQPPAKGNEEQPGAKLGPDGKPLPNAAGVVVPPRKVKPKPALHTVDDIGLMLDVVDGATIKRLITDTGRTPRPPEPAFVQAIKGLPAFHYTLDEMLYAPRNLRANRIYGYSPVEQVITTINIALKRQLSQMEFYTAGNVPDMLLGVPETWTPEQIRQFQEMWDALLSGNTAERRKARFVPGGTQPYPLKDPKVKDEWDDWLARVICFAFSIPYQALVKEVNRATAETSEESSLEQGLEPLKLWWKDVMDAVLARGFLAPELEFIYEDEEISDAATKATVWTSLVAAKIALPNEAREAYGLEPIEGLDDAALAPPPPPMMPGQGGEDGSGDGKGEGGPPGSPPPFGGKKPGGGAPPFGGKRPPQPPPPGAGGKKPPPRGNAFGKGEGVKVASGDRKREPLPPLARVGSKEGAAIQRALDRYLRGSLVRALQQARGKVAKADPDDEEKLKAALAQGLQGAATTAGTAAISQVQAAGGAFSYGNALDQMAEAARDWADDYVGQLITGIDQTTMEAVQDLVEAAIEDGVPYTELAEALEQSLAFSSYRAEMIARTELAFANVQGNIFGWAATGEVEFKEWLVAQDEVCEDCLMMSGVRVPLLDSFTMPDGEEVDGPPGHPNCRCDIVPVLRALPEEEDEGEPAAKFDEGDVPRDDKGRWMTAFHGSRETQIEEWDDKHIGKKNFAGHGHYFAAGPEGSGNFAQAKWEIPGTKERDYGEDGERGFNRIRAFVAGDATRNMTPMELRAALLKDLERSAADAKRNDWGHTEKEVARTLKQIQGDIAWVKEQDVSTWERRKGAIYTVQIPNTLLDWDAPMSEQPRVLVAALEREGIEFEDDEPWHKVYGRYAPEDGTDERDVWGGRNRAKAAAFGKRLSKAGIAGHSYIWSGKRAFVVYSGRDVKYVEKRILKAGYILVYTTTPPWSEEGVVEKWAEETARAEDGRWAGGGKHVVKPGTGKSVADQEAALKLIGEGPAEEAGEMKHLGKMHEALGEEAAHAILGMNSNLRDALDDYQTDGFGALNSYLRHPDAWSDPDDPDVYAESVILRETKVPALTRAMRDAPELDREVVAWRGASGKALAGLKPGTVVRDDGFVSTTMWKSYAAGIARSGINHMRDGRASTLFKIVLPKGSQALYLTDHGGEAYEYELLLQRGARFRVGKMATVGNQSVVVLHYLGSEPQKLRKFEEGDVPRDERGRWARVGSVEWSPAGDFTDSLGIERKDMPQIASHDMDEFVTFARGKGVGVRRERASLADLRPAQRHFNPAQANQMPESTLDKPLTVSEDDYVLDGTNRFIAMLSRRPGGDTAVTRIGLKAREALALMHSFPKTQRKDVSQVGSTATVLGKGWEDVPRDAGGRWAGSGGAGSRVKYDADSWGTFADMNPVQRKWMLDLKKRQKAYEKSDAYVPGTRVDHANRRGGKASDEMVEFLMSHGGMAQFIKANGAEYPVPSKPPPIKIGVPKECFSNAAALVIEHPDIYDYGEGFVLDGNIPFPIHHAFAIEKATGAVVDPTLGWDPTQRYFGIRMTRDQLAKQLLKNKVYGVLLGRHEMPTDILTGKDKGFVKP